MMMMGIINKTHDDDVSELVFFIIIISIIIHPPIIPIYININLEHTKK